MLDILLLDFGKKTHNQYFRMTIKENAYIKMGKFKIDKYALIFFILWNVLIHKSYTKYTS